MRFGRDFPFHQVPKWADSYVDYDEWKHLAKTARSDGKFRFLLIAVTLVLASADNSYAELKRAVARDSRVTECFLDNRYEAVLQHLSILKEGYGITPDSGNTGHLRSLSSYNKKCIKAALVDVATLLASLGDYISLNQRAVERMTTKLGETFDELQILRDNLQVSDARWVRDFQGVNSLLQSLHLNESHERDSILFSESKSSAGTSLKVNGTSSNSDIMPMDAEETARALRNYILCAGQTEEKPQGHQDAREDVRLLLENLQPDARVDVLMRPDSLGRLALHFSARYGMVDVCSDLIEHIKLSQGSVSKGLHTVFFISDVLDETPLSLAISHGHADVIKLFLNQLQLNKQIPPQNVNSLEHSFYGLLCSAIRSQKAPITETLIENMPEVLVQCLQKPKLLYLASQYGQASIVARLLARTSDINFGEGPRDRTPLMVATIYNHRSVLEELLAHPSCDVGVRDINGWTAVDHAAFKGLPALVELLQAGRGGSRISGTEHAQRTQHAARRRGNPNRACVAAKVEAKTSGHSHVFVNLGHFDMDKDWAMLEVDDFRRLVAPVQVPDSSLTICISAIGCDARKEYSVRVPVVEDLSNDPFYWSTKDVSDVKLLFRVYCSVLGRSDGDQTQKPIGSAIVSLKDVRRGLGPSLESLERDYTVPLISSNAEFIGSLTFTFVIVAPFMHPGPAPTPSKVVLRRENSTLVAAHRGLGMNNTKRNRLQLGENTLHSFAAALNAGADILEFDVQVTRDLVPVIYHDFLVSETGTDAAMHNITYEQFMVPSTLQNGLIRPYKASESLSLAPAAGTARKPRASSVGREYVDDMDLIARLKSTFYVQQSGYKGNIGSQCVHGPFATLQQMLVEIDPSVCFDIEFSAYQNDTENRSRSYANLS